MTSTLLLLALTAGSPSSRDVLADAEREFARGVELRADGEAARLAFAQSARHYDALWAMGHRNPAVTRNRGRAKRLAGDLGGAIAALREGLALARSDRDLQRDLEEARAAVAFPLDGELAARCRRKPDRTIGTRVSAADALWVGGGLWLAACGAVARFVMVRTAGWLVAAGACAVALATLAWAWSVDAAARAKDAARPPVVLREDVILRKGNTDLHPPRIDQRLPRGVEARELFRRGGWVQVELADGTIGWVPETSVGG